MTVTSTTAVAEPAGSVAAIEVAESTVNDATDDPKLTVVAPVKPDPVIATAVPPPDAPADGEIDVMTGFG